MSMHPGLNTTPAGVEAGTVDEALDLAASLVDAGRPLEAIDLLTRANRACRDRRLERRLVEVRHLAVAAVEDQPPRAPVRSAFEVPIGAAGLPEVDRSALGAEALVSAVASHGALVVRGFADAVRAEQLRADIDRAFEAFDTRSTAPPDAPSREWFVPFRPPSGPLRERSFVRAAGAVWAADSPPALFDLFEACEDVGMREVLTGYFGARPVVTVHKTSLRRVDPGVHAAWHQDGSFMGRGIRTVNLWITLTDCGGDSATPGLELVPRRFDDVLETGTEGTMMSDQISDAVVAAAAGDAPVLRPEFRVGDAVLFDDLFVHRTAVDEQMRGRRHTIECWFFAPSRHPDLYCPLVF